MAAWRLIPYALGNVNVSANAYFIRCLDFAQSGDTPLALFALLLLLAPDA